MRTFYFCSFGRQVVEKSSSVVATTMAVTLGNPPSLSQTPNDPVAVAMTVLPPETLTTKSNLKSHTATTHSKFRPFECSEPTCRRKFARKLQLIVHSRIHSGEKPFTCTVCGRAFAQKSALTDHYRVHTNERPYACQVTNCKKAFLTSGDLTRHKRTHTGEKVAPVLHAQSTLMFFKCRPPLILAFTTQLSNLELTPPRSCR